MEDLAKINFTKVASAPENEETMVFLDMIKQIKRT